LSLPSTFYALHYMFYHLHSTFYVLPATFFNLRSMIYHLTSKPIYALHSTRRVCSIYALCSTIYHLPSKPIYALCSTIYHPPYKPIHAPLSTFHQLLSAIYALQSYHPPSTLYPPSPSALHSPRSASLSPRATLHDPPSKPVCSGGYWSFLIFFFNFLTKTSEQHKGRLLLVVSYFICDVFRLSETSSGNDDN